MVHCYSLNTMSTRKFILLKNVLYNTKFIELITHNENLYKVYGQDATSGFLIAGSGYLGGTHNLIVSVDKDKDPKDYKVLTSWFSEVEKEQT